MKASFRLVVLVLGIAVVVFVVFVVFVAFVVFMAALLLCVNDPSAVFARHLTRGFSLCRFALCRFSLHGFALHRFSLRLAYFALF